MSALSLPVARAHLNIASDVNDTEIQATIDAAEAVLANVVGPLTTLASRTDRVKGGPSLVLPVAPVVSVSAVTSPDGTTVDLSTVTQNLPAGVLYYTDTGGFWSSVYDVTYVPGRATVPGDLMLAIKEMVRHLWTTQRGGAVRPASTSDVQPTAGFLFPYRVQELVEPYRLQSVGAA